MPESDPRFAADVRAGLGAAEKSLPCVYLYDEQGSRLFEHICELPEYYCTRAESEILRAHAADVEALAPAPAQLVELGSGSSVKTRYLLEAFLSARERVVYQPIDVSGEILAASAEELRMGHPRLEVRPICARYEDGLEAVDRGEGPVLLLWLGSSIGNFERHEAVDFLTALRRQLAPGDQILIGMDLIKDASVLEEAYDDAAGVTAAFNLNLLARINRELGGDFDLERFRHVAFWNAEAARVELHLESAVDQTVRVAALDASFDFAAGERIHTENSHKYDPPAIAALAERVGMNPLAQWFDERRRFSLNLFDITGSD